MTVRFTAEAEGDLEAIADRIAEGDPARAVSFVEELRARCLSLLPFPERFALGPRYEAQGVRHCVHGNYLIFYRVQGAEVTVIHILHGAIDYAGVLFPQ
jgi:plasmid stabilization system protein ParE